MSETPKDASGDKPRPPSRNRTPLRVLVAIISLLTLITGAGEVLSLAKPGLDEAAKRARIEHIYQVQTEVDDRIRNCDYFLLVFCKPKAPAPNSFAELWAEHSIQAPSYAQNGITGFVLSAAVMAPKLPDAFLHVLGLRLGGGALEFWIGLAYVLIYLAVIVVAFRSNILAGCAAVLVGGWVATAIFWVLRMAIIKLDAAVGGVITFCLAVASFPGFAFVCFPHHMMVAWESVVAIGRPATRH